MKNRSQIIIIFILLLTVAGLGIITVNLYKNNRILAVRSYEKQPVVYDLAYNLRRIPIKEFPNISANNVDYLEENSKVEIIELSNTWARIRFLNQVGYVNSRDLTIQEASKKVATADLPFRKSPNSGEIVFIITKGSVVEYIEEIGEWGKVYYNNRVGYVSNRYLSEYKYDSNVTNVKPKGR